MSKHKIQDYYEHFDACIMDIKLWAIIIMGCILLYIGPIHLITASLITIAFIGFILFMEYKG